MRLVASATALSTVRVMDNTELARRAKKTPQLTAAEEQDLAHRIAAGLVWDDDTRAPVPQPGATPGQIADAREAAEAFISANVAMVYQAVGWHTHGLAEMPGLDKDDLVGEGLRVLIEHVYRFDPARGFRFSSFAGGKAGPISRSLSRLLYVSGRPVRLTHRVYALMAKARTYVERVERTDGRTPELDEVAAHCRVTPAYLREKMADLPAGFHSLDAAQVADARQDAFRGSPGPVSELPDAEPGPEDEVVDGDGVRAVWMALDALPADVREVIALRFGFTTGQPESLDAIGEKLGVSWRQVTNLEQRGIAQLREDGTLAGLLGG